MLSIGFIHAVCMIAVFTGIILRIVPAVFMPVLATLFIFGQSVIFCRKFQEEIFTKANLVSYLRLLLLPVVAWAGAKSPQFASAIFIVALLLDGVDGLIARRLNCSTSWGAKLDSEVDAIAALTMATVLCLSGFAILAGAIGLMRYGFVVWRQLFYISIRAERRLGVGKNIYVVAACALALAPWIDSAAANLALTVALLGIITSIGLDVRFVVTRYHNLGLKEYLNA